MPRKILNQTVKIGCQHSTPLTAVDILRARTDFGQRSEMIIVHAMMIVHALQRTSIEQRDKSPRSWPPAFQPCQAEHGQRYATNDSSPRHGSLLRLFPRLHKISFGIHGWNVVLPDLETQSQHF